VQADHDVSQDEQQVNKYALIAFIPAECHLIFCKHADTCVMRVAAVTRRGGSIVTNDINKRTIHSTKQ
jgi:hypothetical protein